MKALAGKTSDGRPLLRAHPPHLIQASHTGQMRLNGNLPLAPRQPPSQGRDRRGQKDLQADGEPPSLQGSEGAPLLDEPPLEKEKGCSEAEKPDKSVSPLKTAKTAWSVFFPFHAASRDRKGPGRRQWRRPSLGSLYADGGSERHMRPAGRLASRAWARWRA